MLDVWVCSNCHSLNRERSMVCYKCGGPREQSTGEGEGLRPARAIQARLNADSLSAFVQSSKELLAWSFDLDVVTTAMIAFGAVTLVVIIGQVERRAAARNREIEATLGSA